MKNKSCTFNFNSAVVHNSNPPSIDKSSEGVLKVQDKDYFFIVNPAAGGGRKMEAINEIETFFQDRNLDFEMVLTKAPRHATELTKKAANDGYKIVVAVGGDGTVNEVVNGLVGTNSTLGIIPIGSGNDFSRAIGLARNIKKDLKILLAKKTREIDLGFVNNRYFVDGLGIGFDAEASMKVRKFLKYLNGFLAYLASVLRTLVTYQFPQVKITLDNSQVIKMGILLMAVMNGPRYGAGFYVAPSAKIDDGLFTICLIEKCGRFYALRQIPKVLKGTHVKLPIVKIITSKQVKIESESILPAHVDGEILPPQQKFEAKIVPKCLKVISA